MSKQVKLTDQQYTIMQALWSLGSGSTKQVQQAITTEDWAITTVGTVLARLEKKDILSSKANGREKIFTPLIAEKDVKKSMVGGLISNLFKGDPKALLAHLLNEGDIQEGDLQDIESLLQSDKADQPTIDQKGQDR